MLDQFKKEGANQRVWDIGSGYGFMREKCLEMELEYLAFDAQPKTEEVIKWDLNFPMTEIDHRPSFILLLEVLEHLENPGLGLKYITEKLNNGGLLILTVPNPSSSKDRIHHFLKGSLYSFQPKHLSEHHVFTPWYHIVGFLLKQNQMEVIEYVNIVQNRSTFFGGGVKGFVKRSLEKTIEKLDPSSVGMNYGLVAKKVNQ